jgi:glutamate 5-kinase
LIRAWMQQVAQLRKRHGVEVIWVTSGAIATAVERTDFKRRPSRSLPEKQALSAIGQPLIMDLYTLALQATDLLGAQVLLTAGDIQDRVRRKNLQNSLNKLLEWNVVPILNENDAVATEEIRFGDNDSLSSKIARMMKAERLILMTDVDGLYDSDPKRDRTAALIPYLRRIGDKELRHAPRHAVSTRGTGGMHSKLLAAGYASKAGITTHFVRGDWPNNLLAIANGERIGTQIGGSHEPKTKRK